MPFTLQPLAVVLAVVGLVSAHVLLVRRKGVVAHVRAYGQQDREEGRPMAVDTIFRAASMTKAVTAAATMMLVEQGKLKLDDALAGYLPGFAHTVVAELSPTDASGFVTVPARRPIQVVDLLTHTAGLTYGEGLATKLYQEAHLCDWYLLNRDETIAAAVDRLATLPLHAHPRCGTMACRTTCLDGSSRLSRDSLSIAFLPNASSIRWE